MTKRKQQSGFRAIFFLVSGFWLLVTGVSTADTIHTRDGREIKGIIVEDYTDRVVFSTADGEISIMKSDIGELYFDSEEDNLIKLAEQAVERNDYGRAYSYYSKAYKLNPDSKRAKDGLVLLQSYMFRRDEAKKEASVRRQEEIERYGSYVEAMKGDTGEFERDIEKLKDSAGIVISVEDSIPQISKIMADSPAYQAGVRRFDRLVAIWGKLSGYMSLQEVVSRLLEKSSLEVKCTIERTIEIPLGSDRTLFSGTNDIIGASFSMEFDGLTIADVKEYGAASAAGAEKGDLVTAIYGQSTRYMLLKKAVEMIKDSKSDTVKLTIRRAITFWRR